MPVDDKEFGALLALLSGRAEEHDRLLDDLDPAGQAAGYSALVAAAMFRLAERRFIRDGKYVPASEIVAYVAHARAKSDDFAEELDPRIAERVLLAALDQDDIDDIEAGKVFYTELGLLVAMVHDEQFASESDIETFLQGVRPLADDWMEP